MGGANNRSVMFIVFVLLWSMSFIATRSHVFR